MLAYLFLITMQLILLLELTDMIFNFTSENKSVKVKEKENKVKQGGFHEL